ncbi:class II lanthipeptide, LchA2/BrtA2 family [Sporosarcina soli]|uniref:Class II lanthipeptide, LchA2/BrtA2 family n=1 Tax=Sporosarcina soli TaxID=334736 RepID=A0ABW0TK55_9BACL
MTQIENTIMAWKNPDFRTKDSVVSPAGEVSEQELMATVGGSDITPQTTLPCVVVLTLLACK